MTHRLGWLIFFAIGCVGTVGCKTSPSSGSVTTTPEPAGANCAAGGVKVVSSSGTSYVCNGASGAAGTSVTSSVEPAGANCPSGGTKLVSSNATTYVCNGGGGSAASWSDGSAGDLVITGVVDWTASPPTSTNNQFATIHLTSGSVWTVPSGLQLRVGGAVTMDDGSSLVVAAGPSSSVANPESGIAVRGADHRSGGVGVASLQAASILHLGPSGGGAGAGTLSAPGGGGGGALVIRAQGGFMINGAVSLTADGLGGTSNASATGGGGGGGGAGGVVVLAWGTGTGTPLAGLTISAQGGVGGNGSPTGNYCGGGGGGGGLVTLLGPHAADAIPTLTLGAGLHGTDMGAIIAGNLSGSGGGASGGSGGRGCDGTGTSSQSGTIGTSIATSVADPSGMFN